MNNTLLCVDAVVGYDSDLGRIDFELEGGGSVRICGSNGQGKTTVLETILGFVATRSGQVRWQDRGGVEVSPGYLLRKREVVYVPQRSVIYQDLSLREHLDIFVSDNCDAVRRGILRSWESIGELALEPGRRAGAMSGGEQQFVGLLRLWEPRARALILDEVLVGLQKHLAERVVGFVRDRVENEEIAVVWVEHERGMTELLRQLPNQQEVVLAG